jgi:hypothetical protein
MLSLSRDCKRADAVTPVLAMDEDRERCAPSAAPALSEEQQPFETLRGRYPIVDPDTFAKSRLAKTRRFAARKAPLPGFEPGFPD